MVEVAARRREALVSEELLHRRSRGAALPVLNAMGARTLAKETGFKVRSIYNVLNTGARPHPAGANDDD